MFNVIQTPGQGKNLFNFYNKRSNRGNLQQTTNFAPEEFNACYGAWASSGYTNPTPLSNLAFTRNSFTFTTAVNWYGFGVLVPVEPSTQYTLSWSGEVTAGAAAYKPGTLPGNIVYDSALGQGQNSPWTFTVPAGATHIAVIFGNVADGGSGRTFTVTNPQLEKGSQATTYEQYTEYKYYGAIAVPVGVPRDIYDTVEYVDNVDTITLDLATYTFSDSNVFEHDIQLFNNGKRTLIGFGVSAAQYIGKGSSGTNTTWCVDQTNTGVTCLERKTVSFYRNTGTQGKGHIVIDGIDTAYSGGATDITGPYKVFGISGAFSGHVRLWGFKVRASITDNTILHNYIPVKRKSDNAVGLYEVKTGTFYTKAGLLAGPVIDASTYYMLRGGNN